MWYVYILKCVDDSLYTGITTDLERRLFEHNFSAKWAKYTKIRRPVELFYSQIFNSRIDASKEEYRIKRLSRKQKEELIKSEEI